MFNKRNSKNHHQVAPYIKPPVTMELKVRVKFFSTKMRAFSEFKLPLGNFDLPLVTKLAKQDFAHLYTNLQN